MLTKIFRPKWQHADPKVRHAFVERMSKDDQALISTILSSDECPDVRLSAFSKLNSFQQKIDWIKTPPAEGDRPAFIKTFIAQLDDQHTAQSLKPETIMQLKQNGLLDTLIKHSSNAALIDQIITETTDENLCVNYLQHAKNHAIRHKLALRIHTKDALKTAYQWAKSKDKTTAKLLKQKLDTLQSARKHQEADMQKAESLLNKLTALKKGTSTIPLEAEWSAAKQTFDAIHTRELPSTLVTSIELSLAEIKKDIDQTEQDKQAKLNAETEQALQTNSLKDFKKAAEHIASQLDNAETLTPDIATAFEKLNEALTADNVIDENDRQQLQAEISSLQTQHQHLLALKSLLQPTHENNIDARDAKKQQTDINRLAAKLNPSSIWVKKAHETVISLNEQINQEKKQRQDTLNTLKSHVNDAEVAIDNKQLKESQQFLSKIRRAFNQLPPHEQDKWRLTLKRVENGVKSLTDWRKFSTDPIRQTLLTKMESLIDASMDAHEKTQAVKALQKDWQALGYTEDQKMWDDFQALANKAYAPCKEAFEKEKSRRLFNAEQREKICEETEQFTADCDWARADYKALDKLLKTIHKEWKRFSPVERSQHQALQARFSTSTQCIKEKLQTHKNDNLAKLESLNAQAQALTVLEDSQQAINDYKTLMSEWKTVGITFREKQTTQWEAFRASGDQIYAKQKADKQLDQETERAQVNQYKTYLDNIKQLTNALADVSADANAIAVDYNKTCKHFQDLSAVSTKAQSNLRKSFDKHCLQFDAARKQHQDAQWKHQLSYFNQYAATLANHANEAEAFENLLPEWKTAIAEQRKKWAHQPHTQNFAINCCIDLEILCDKPSPESDNEARINRQMQLLQRNFGLENTNKDKKTAIEAHYLEWFGQPINFLNEHTELTSRFLACVGT